MTNKLAIIIGLIILTLLIYDYSQNDWETAIFLAQKFVALIEWMAFWR